MITSNHKWLQINVSALTRKALKWVNISIAVTYDWKKVLLGLRELQSHTATVLQNYADVDSLGLMHSLRVNGILGLFWFDLVWFLVGL